MTLTIEVRVLREQTRLSYRQARTAGVGNIVVAGACAGLVMYLLLPWFSVLPFVFVVLSQAVRLVHIRQFTTDETCRDPTQWHRVTEWDALAAGLSWGSVGALAYPWAPVELQMILMIIAAGMTAAAVGTLSPIRRAYLAYLLPFSFGITAATGFFFPHFGLLACGLLAFYAVVMARIGREQGEAVVQALRLSIQNQALVEQLVEAAERDKQRDAQLAQAQKLESVGRLASGVAHEINTPVQFVSDSVHFLKDASVDLLVLVGALGAVRVAVQAGTETAELIDAALEAEQRADLPYLTQSIPRALDLSLEGLGRVAEIVRSMKEFAHPDSIEKTPVDINRGIETTLIMARNEYRFVADLETRLGVLPLIGCHAGQINQVVLNLIVNGAHAIAEKVKDTGKRGLITVATRVDGHAAIIEISDTGGGIPPAVQGKIFDPFFTTKEVGRGTGQGLAIARVVMERQGGTIGFETREGEGTTFTLRLPLPPREAHGALAIAA